jgi:hypothetical protein
MIWNRSKWVLQVSALVIVALLMAVIWLVLRQRGDNPGFSALLVRCGDVDPLDSAAFVCSDQLRSQCHCDLALALRARDNHRDFTHGLKSRYFSK